MKPLGRLGFKSPMEAKLDAESTTTSPFLIIRRCGNVDPFDTNDFAWVTPIEYGEELIHLGVAHVVEIY